MASSVSAVHTVQFSTRLSHTARSQPAHRTYTPQHSSSTPLIPQTARHGTDAGRTAAVLTGLNMRPPATTARPQRPTAVSGGRENIKWPPVVHMAIAAGGTGGGRMGGYRVASPEGGPYKTVTCSYQDRR